MLCLKKKKFWGSSSSYGPQNQSRSYGVDQGSGVSSEDSNKRGNRDSRTKEMAPPPTAAPAIHPVVREVTEDTPPDLLEGTMDLLVVLPSGKTVQTTVDRKTPMMDLLIHTATANKINPAGHIAQVRNERGIEMPYKPSTPIGALDTTTIEIVPKNRVNEYIIVKKPAKVANQPFETTFRLQVHLPRNQLYVLRISPKTQLDEILREVCHEKNLDISKYEIRHPVNLDQKLPLSMTVGETGLQELTVVSKNSKINSSVSSADIIALQQSDGKGCLDGSFKHSRSSVGDSSVSSESTGSGRGISPCRSEDSRSISPLPLIRPKALLHSRPSNVSTCSSSGNSSGLLKSHMLENSHMSSQVSHQQVIMQAPPRTKKRAAPKPPSTPGAKVSSLNCSTTSSISSPISENSVLVCSTPISANNPSNGPFSKVAAGPPEKPTPRKKEAPREPPKHHPPLSHHQSLPISHLRHNSASPSSEQQQQEGCPIRQNHNGSMSLERSNHTIIAKMSSGHSISSSMTNLTSVSSVSSTSLASSTGGSKKRRAPKPPASSAINPPTQIEEESTTTDGETSSIRGGGGTNGLSQQRQDQVKVDVHHHPSSSSERLRIETGHNTKETEVLSVSPVSSLSSASHSASDSASSSPIPPATQELPSKSKGSTMKERSLNTNGSSADGRGTRNPLNDESGGSGGVPYSRPSRSSSSNNNNVTAATSPDSVRSRNRIPPSSSVAVDDAQSVVEETSSRPPSSNTQVSSSSRPMPMPLPRRRAPTAPENDSNKVSDVQIQKREQAEFQQHSAAEPQPKPKPRTRPDRISVENMISQTSVIIKPKLFHSRQSTDSLADDDDGDDDEAADQAVVAPPVSAAQLRNPMAKYGVKVLPDNVQKERAERLQRQNIPDAHASADAQNVSTSVKASSKTSGTSDEFSDNGSVTSFTQGHAVKNPNLGKSGLPAKPVPSLSKSDYTSQGSVRSIKQLTTAASSISSESSSAIEDDEQFDSDNLEENLDFFEPVKGRRASGGKLTKSLSSQRAAQVGKENASSLKTKARVSSSVSAYEDVEKEEDGRSSHSPGVVSESGRRSSHHEYTKKVQKESTEEAENAKLNRWQNMVSLNEIESAKEGGRRVPASGRNSSSTNNNMPFVASAQVSSPSPFRPSKQNTYLLLPLHGDYQLTTKSHLSVEESQIDATCHSSESEASYTDSGVPATETVTPSPVNLDDVILEQDYRAETPSEKFSSKDEAELKNSSRRSSLHSDHSEEWMNVLEANINKNEEAIEKMFEAALPETGEEINRFSKGTEKETELSSPSSEESETLLDSIPDEHSTREIIETTVELHHTPSHSNEVRDSQQTSPITKTSPAEVPPRKLSKSESFSHNSEFDEAKQRRKNFYSARSNAVHRGSNSSGSATDIRHSGSMSSSEEEDFSGPMDFSEKSKAAGRIRKMPQTTPRKKAPAGRDDRTVSMSDLTSSKNRGKADDSISTNALAENTAQKSSSMQKLTGEMPDEIVVMDKYKKELEMQFEQWKEEFMKTHITQPDEEDVSNKVEQTVTHDVHEPEVEDLHNSAYRVATPEPRDPEVPQIIHSVGAAARVVTDKPSARTKVAADDLKEARSESPNASGTFEKVPVPSIQEAAEDWKMRNTSSEFPPVELRKKRVETKDAPPVVYQQYQYTGPPTFKIASYNEGPRRVVSVKTDKDYIMGFGQQDASAKQAMNPSRIHSFHGGPLVPLTQAATDNSSAASVKNKRESSPTPPVAVKGWSAALNSSNLLPNSTGGVRNVVSAWKQKMEETEKVKPKEGPPDEIDLYAGTENVQKEVVAKPVPSKTVTEAPIKPVSIEKVTPQRSASVAVTVTEYQPKPKPAPPKVIAPPITEKSKSLGSSFRTEKPVVFTMSAMDSSSNTMPKSKPAVTTIPPKEVVNSKPSPATSTVDIMSSSSLQERKKFFQGVKPVENNAKESPIPAANLKSNIAVIQKVFEKQRVSKMQQMGSQQSLHSDGTISPVPSLQRNDSLDSRQSNNNTLRRQNSIESHSSDSSSVVLRVSQNSSGKVSPQMSANEMVHKLFTRPNSFNVDAHRRTPSPISSTTSTLSSSTSYERFTPSPTVVDGPNNSVRITMGGYKPPNQNASPAIRNVGNKAIIIVNGEDETKNANKGNRLSAKQDSSSANNIILDQGSSNIKKSPVTSTYMSAINQQQQSPKPAPIAAAPKPAPIAAAPKPAPIAAVPVKPLSVSAVSQAPRKTSIEPVTPQKPVQSNVKSAPPTSNGVPPPPPPPPVEGMTPNRKIVDVGKANSVSSVRSSKPTTPTTPTTPTSPDPRAEICNVIKNSNGNFGLRKTGSTLLLK